MTTSTGWAEAVLIVTVLAPMAAVALAVGIAVPGDHHRWTTAGCAVSATGAFVLLAAGQRPEVARLAPDDLALVATLAVALLALAAGTSRAPELAAATTVAICGVTAGAPGRPSIVGPVLAVAAVVVLLAFARDAEPLAVATIAAATVAVAAGVHAGGRGGAAVALLGVAVTAVVAGLVPRRAIAIVVPVALSVGLRIAPTVASTGTARWVAVVAGAAAIVPLAAMALAPRWRAVVLAAALGPWAVVAAVEPVHGTAGAARILAAAAVLALLLGGPLALVAAVPGAAVFASALADGRGWPRPVLAVLAALTFAGVLRGPVAGVRARLRIVDGVALALAAWLVVRPTAWTWAHAPVAGAYNEGTVVALASGSIAAVVLSALGAPSTLAPIAGWLVAGDSAPAGARARYRIPVTVLAAALGIAAALLVRSARL